MGQDLITDAEKIRLATQNSLKRAEGLGIKSIAFPALGTGVGGFPAEKAAEAMLETTAAHLRGESGLEEVVFVLFDESLLRVFEGALWRHRR
jgi:O-acetyl-ADP-ribose deacetylase (regulator of RNase III)